MTKIQSSIRLALVAGVMVVFMVSCDNNGERSDDSSLDSIPDTVMPVAQPTIQQEPVEEEEINSDTLPSYSDSVKAAENTRQMEAFWEKKERFQTYLDEMNFPKMAEVLEELVETDPSAYYYMHLGNAYFNMTLEEEYSDSESQSRLFDASKNALRQSISMEPESFDAIYLLGAVCTWSGLASIKNLDGLGGVEYDNVLTSAKQDAEDARKSVNQAKQMNPDREILHEQALVDLETELSKL